MKKLLILVLALLITLACASAAAEVEITDFPAEVNWAELIDLNNYMKTVFPGAHRMTFKDGEKEYTAVACIGENYNQSQPLVVIIPDSGMTAGQVLNEGGWADIAAANDLLVLVMDPAGAYDQSLEGETFAQINATFKAAGNKTYFTKSKGSNFVVAYGDAASLTTAAVEVQLPGAWAGLIVFGDVELTAADIANRNGTELPVWMFVSELDQEAELVELFKGYNGCTDEAFSNAEADYVYFPKQQVNDLLADNQPMSQVRVTVTADAAALNAGRAAAVYSFLQLGTRNVGFGDAKMGYARTVEQWGATIETLEVDGVTRWWVQYVPTTLRETAEGKAPLLVVTHGGSLNGIYFAERTQLIRLAEERGFIVVFPNGSISPAKGQGTTWNNLKAEDQWDDVKFIAAMIEHLKETLPVDGARCYSYGHSMGCLMSFAMSYYTDLYAASAGSGAASIPYNPDAQRFTTPRYMILGQKDMDNASLSDEKIRAWINASAENLGLADADHYNGKFKTGRFHNYVWEDEKGVPMMRYTSVEEMGHTSTLDLLSGVYDWLSQFSRGEDGSIVYGGGISNEL